MTSRTIKPPKSLHDKHGSSTALFDIILTYSAGILDLIFVYVLYLQNTIDIPIWKLTLLLVVSADIGAGVILLYHC